MILNINDDQQLENPTEATVRTIVAGLQPDTFVVLARADEDFVQTYFHDDGTYQLEFRAGSYDQHFRATSETISIEDVLEAFATYLTGKKDWSNKWEWEIVEFDEDFEGDLTYENAYVINGVEYEKVKFGNETNRIESTDQACRACGVAIGEYHKRDCEFEECPRCHAPICGCDCE